MELVPVPRRPGLPGRGLVLLGVVASLPVVLLVLVPVMLGLDRSVVRSTSMAGSIDRGSVVFHREVPVSDLRVGDVITFRPEHPGAGPDTVPVTSRIISIDQGRVRTQGDARAAADPGALVIDAPTQARVSFAVPWVGYPFLGVRYVATWVAWGVLTGVVLVAASVLARGSVRRQRPQHRPIVVAGRPGRSRLAR